MCNDGRKTSLMTLCTGDSKTLNIFSVYYVFYLKTRYNMSEITKEKALEYHKNGKIGIDLTKPCASKGVINTN